MTIKEEITHHAARAFFACAWADVQESKADGENLSGVEIMDVMPEEIDPAAIHAAWTLVFDTERANGRTIEALLTLAQASATDRNDRPCDAEYFGHYLAMEAMGSGVGLECVTDAAIDVPYIEFSECSLEKDY